MKSPCGQAGESYPKHTGKCPKVRLLEKYTVGSKNIVLALVFSGEA